MDQLYGTGQSLHGLKTGAHTKFTGVEFFLHRFLARYIGRLNK